eukprot:TRINITY_DN56166_c0_g1_i1.p2 TRINITY_DN56166_c0_g1~~TRINITY_DN56166_c0_g1_i1.p2  ORF type:complete len:155 (+),score=16.47 TRINITY_DN56166_c0_g1_i1:26-490(+)
MPNQNMDWANCRPVRPPCTMAAVVAAAGSLGVGLAAECRWAKSGSSAFVPLQMTSECLRPSTSRGRGRCSSLKPLRADPPRKVRPPRQLPTWLRRWKRQIRKILPLISIVSFVALGVVRRRRAGSIHDVALSSLIDMLEQHTRQGLATQEVVGA